MSTIRVTKKDLQYQLDRLNELTGNSKEPWTMVDGKLTANIGNYHLANAYGGYQVQQMMNEYGGVKNIFWCGYTSKRRLSDLIHAFTEGILQGCNNANIS